MDSYFIEFLSIQYHQIGKLFSLLKLSSYNPPAPFASSGALRSLKPDFPEQGQPLAAGEYETEAQAVLNDEFSVSPPQHTAVRQQEDSINYGLLGNDDWDEASGRNGSFADFVRENNSSYCVVDPYTNEEAPGHTYFDQRHRTNNNESSTSILGLKGEHTVKQLRLSKALTVRETTTIYEACRRMTARRTDAVLLTNSDELLSGILTNKDIVRRVIAAEIDFVNTPVSKVMTKNPKFVLSNTLVVEALNTMLDGQFGHLPVVENDVVIGLLDMAAAVKRLNLNQL
ncbi:unnamed protein product [Lactuca virosa]|uniref:CBS domain-containing protein n=1 Tax=Lactuca virosa TaxID=75947 RepID=A0AAU9MM73_9ASTR|nr:unnamed protein product [Lactuca virosa]